jgi:hypothetical protein
LRRDISVCFIAGFALLRRVFAAGQSPAPERFEALLQSNTMAKAPGGQNGTFQNGLSQIQPYPFE